MLDELDDKEAGLKQSMTCSESTRGMLWFEVDPRGFSKIPGSPFAYWVQERLRLLYSTLQPLESGGRVARRGINSNDDERFLRLAWECDRGPWALHAKGGVWSPYYADPYMYVKWGKGGEELKAERVTSRAYKTAIVPSEELYFRPGLTWSRRTKRALSMRVLPAECIFGDKGPAIIVENNDPQELLLLLAVCNSKAFHSLMDLQLAAADANASGAARSYEVGVLQRMPLPELGAKQKAALSALAYQAWSLRRELDTSELTSHAFVAPALVQCSGTGLAARADNWRKRVSRAEVDIAEVQFQIDGYCFDCYGFDPEDRRMAGEAESAESSRSESGVEPEADGAKEESSPASVEPPRLAAAFSDWLVGVAFGRFDLRLGTGVRVAPLEPAPFAQLPVCSPGMLKDDDGYPLQRAPAGYPIDFPSDGILVDDPGPDETAPAPRDLVLRMRAVVHILWSDEAESIEAELCRMLTARTLRDWLRRPAGFFADHLARYSKSRRKAPIYWPLSTESGDYTLWVYYPQLTDQTLYACVTEHLDPKLKELEADARRLRGTGLAERGRQTRLAKLEELRRELEAMRDELLRVAGLPYKPSQDDGVLITAAPLWKLFRHKLWQRELEKRWKALELGECDWAHLALAIWPERVRETCRNDKSIAIAHELEDLYEGD